VSGSKHSPVGCARFKTQSNRVCPVQNAVQSGVSGSKHSPIRRVWFKTPSNPGYCKTRKENPPSVRGRVLDHSAVFIYALNRVVVFTGLTSDLRLDRLKECQLLKTDCSVCS
jgi:hypothetical protein